MLTTESRTERVTWKSLSYGFQGKRVPYWDGKVMVPQEWVWLHGSACAHVGLSGRHMYTSWGVSGWMYMAVIPFNTQRASWTNLIQ